jgi:hypothetical protein
VQPTNRSTWEATDEKGEFDHEQAQLHLTGDSIMSDIIYILLTIVAFGLLLLFAKACEKV